MPPLLPEALTTLSNLKEALSLTSPTSSDTSKDSLLTGIINRVTLWLEGETHRKLVARHYKASETALATTSVPSENYLYFSGYEMADGGDVMTNPQGCGEYYLPHFPVQRTSASLTFALAVLTNRASTISGGQTWDTSAYVEYDHYIVDDENGILRLLGGPFIPGVKNYRITCTAGYLYPSANPVPPFVPPDLESLCIELCKQMFRESGKVQSESIGTWSRTYRPDAKDAHVDHLLGRYTRLSL